MSFYFKLYIIHHELKYLYPPTKASCTKINNTL